MSLYIIQCVWWYNNFFAFSVFDLTVVSFVKKQWHEYMIDSNVCIMICG